MNGTIVTFLIGVMNIWENKLIECWVRFGSQYSARVQSIMALKAGRQEHEAAGHIASAFKKDGCLCSAHFLLTLCIGSEAEGW